MRKYAIYMQTDKETYRQANKVGWIHSSTHESISQPSELNKKNLSFNDKW